MALMVRVCVDCAEAWPPADGTKCPVCKEERPTVDAIAVIKRLATAVLDEEAERREREEAVQ